MVLPIVWHRGRPLRTKSRAYECPFCLETIGVFGRIMDAPLGGMLHGCRRSNILSPAEVSDRWQTGMTNPYAAEVAAGQPLAARSTS